MDICEECNQECKAVEESFDYAGTHCTNGKPGTYKTGHYVSDCCGAEIGEEKYSNCCGEPMPDWPDSDLCPACKEHV